MDEQNRKRRQRLVQGLEELDRLLKTLRDEVARFEQQKQQQQDLRGRLDEKHAAACKAAALGQESDREKIEREQSGVDAVIRGLGTVLAEKSAEIDELNGRRNPIDHEIVAIDRAEQIQDWTRQINEAFEAGRAHQLRVWELEKQITARIETLRRDYQDPSVRSLAFSAADKLASARQGKYLSDTFSHEELLTLG